MSFNSAPWFFRFLWKLLGLLPNCHFKWHVQNKLIDLE